MGQELQGAVERGVEDQMDFKIVVILVLKNELARQGGFTRSNISYNNIESAFEPDGKLKLLQARQVLFRPVKKSGIGRIRERLGFEI
jgi:hypothetical protein